MLKGKVNYSFGLNLNLQQLKSHQFMLLPLNPDNLVRRHYSWTMARYICNQFTNLNLGGLIYDLINLNVLLYLKSERCIGVEMPQKYVLNLSCHINFLIWKLTH